MEDFIVRKEITINADPSKVWDALTNPEKTKKYFFNCQVFSDWKPGSSITFKGRLFLIKKIEMNGRIIHVEPGKFLQYSIQNRNSNTSSMVTDELLYENGKTTIRIMDNIGKGKQAESRYDKSVIGWDKILKGLKKVVEKETH